MLRLFGEKSWVGPEPFLSYYYFLPFENFRSCFGVRCTFLDYAGLLAAIPEHWKNAILDSNRTASNESLVRLLSVDNVSPKRTRLLLAERPFCRPVAKFRLKEQSIRAAVPKYRLEVCKMKKNRKSPNFVRKLFLKQ